MPYCLIVDIDLTLKELIQLTDDNVPLLVTVEALEAAMAAGDMTGFPENVQVATPKALDNIDKAIDYAGMLINANVGERYALPFTAVPELVKSIAVDLATWKLFYRKKKDKLPEAVQKAYDNSMKLLGQIRDGKIGIGVTPAGSKVEPEAGSMLTAGTKPLFTNDTLERY
jgi:phage gp36-like protein